MVPSGTARQQERGDQRLAPADPVGEKTPHRPGEERAAAEERNHEADDSGQQVDEIRENARPEDPEQLRAGTASGERHVAVYPTLGWWEGREERKDAAVPYSLVVSIDAGDADIDLYAEIEAAIAVPIELG